MCEVISNRIWDQYQNELAGTNGFHMGVLVDDTVYDSDYPGGIPLHDWRGGAYTVPADCGGPQVSFREAEFLRIGVVYIYDYEE